MNANDARNLLAPHRKAILDAIITLRQVERELVGNPQIAMDCANLGHQLQKVMEGNDVHALPQKGMWGIDRDLLIADEEEQMVKLTEFFFGDEQPNDDNGICVPSKAVPATK